MLKSIIIKNFKSVVDLEVDFSYDEAAPGGYKTSDILSFLEPNRNKNDRITPVMMFYGANATGKSNIMYVISILKFIVGARSAGDCVNILRKFYKINKLHNLGEDISFEIDFFVNGKKHTYKLIYNFNEIVFESLSIKDKELYRVEKGELFINFVGSALDRVSKIKNEFTVQALSFNLNTNRKMQVRTFLNVVTDNFPNIDSRLFDAYDFINNKIIFLDANTKNISTSQTVKFLAGSEKEQDIQNAFSRIANLIRKIDIDITKLEFSNESIDGVFEGNKIKIPMAMKTPGTYEYNVDVQNNKIVSNKVVSYHKNLDDKNVEFDFRTEESLGTQVVFSVIGLILKALQDGCTLLVDEIDQSLHPLVLRELMQMFKMKEYNKNNAQLITTLHETILLEDNIYRKSEFSFVNKSLKKGTYIKRLSQIKGEKGELNFRKRYLRGQYTGLPYTYL